MNSALLVVSFGTTHLDTMEKAIAATERVLGEAFPHCPVYRAFTSAVVRKRLAENQKIHICSVEEALAQIAADGFEHVLVQPTLLIPGEEYEKLRAAVRRAAGTLQVKIGQPLLAEEKDLDTVLTLLQKAYPTAPDTILVLMGHGTAHCANRFYEQLAARMRMLEYPTMRLCAVEGTPSFDTLLQELSALPQRKIRLVPFLFVAGDHTKNDMAGSGPESLCSLLRTQGFTVSCILQSLGELAEIRNLFVQRVRALHPECSV